VSSEGVLDKHLMLLGTAVFNTSREKYGLAANIDTSLGHTSTEQALLRGFFRFAQLRL
jgi:hypothetical protein